MTPEDSQRLEACLLEAAESLSEHQGWRAKKLSEFRKQYEPRF